MIRVHLIGGPLDGRLIELKRIVQTVRPDGVEVYHAFRAEVDGDKCVGYVHESQMRHARKLIKNNSGSCWRLRPKDAR